MNKKGFFMTLTAVLILAVVVFLVIISNEEQTKISEVRVQYAKHKVTTNYIKDIEEIYIPEIVRTSEKIALREISENRGQITGPLKAELEDVIKTGKMLNNAEVMDKEQTIVGLRNQTIDTISFGINFTSFDVEVLDISHADDAHIEVRTRVSFAINSKTFTGIGESDIRWENEIITDEIISVYGLLSNNPNGHITRKWKTDITKPCFLKTLDSSISCSGYYGLTPLS